MRRFPPEWSCRLFRQWMTLAGLFCLIGNLAGTLAFASPLFAGVTGIEARPEQAGGVQPLNFQSDLPFQYQLQVRDHDHIILRLYNARISGNLLTPEGGVNLLSGGAIQSATLKKPDKDRLVSDDYQEIILTGPGLGDKKLKITGATELPLPVAKSISTLSAKAANAAEAGQKVANPRIEPARLASSTDRKQATSNRQPKAQIATSNKHDSKKSSLEPVAMMMTAEKSAMGEQSTSKGPQIAAMKNVTGPATGQARPLIIENTPRYTSPSYQPVQDEVAVQREAPPEQEAVLAPPQDAPEPAYQILTPLPRYQGGAAPIVAMTTDNSGKPVLIRPKNQAIPEFGIGADADGYNTLFQAELESGPRQVNHLMAEALDAYRGKRYEQALKQIQQALQLDGNNADLYAALAEIQIKLNQLPQASEAYQKASEKSGEKYGHRYAQVLVLAGKRQDAVQVLKKLYQQDEKQVQIAYMLGTLYEEMGQTAEALPYLKQAAALHPASADIQYNLGLAYELSGDRLRAEKHYQQALKLNQNATDIRKALARVKGD